ILFPGVGVAHRVHTPTKEPCHEHRAFRHPARRTCPRLAPPGHGRCLARRGRALGACAARRRRAAGAQRAASAAPAAPPPRRPWPWRLKELPMPLVTLTLRRSAPTDLKAGLLDAVHDALVGSGVPADDL